MSILKLSAALEFAATTENRRLLRKLAQHPDPAVRQAVARNPNSCPEAHQSILERDIMAQLSNRPPRTSGMARA